MSNRPAGGARSKRWPKQEYDWFCEPRWLAEQIFDEISFGDPGAPDLIFDPCCGTGNILDVAKARGHPTIGGDIIDRHPKHRFNRGNILINQPIPSAPPGRSISVVTNPPYSYEQDVAEKVIRRVLDVVPIRRAAFILPIAFLAGQNRWRFFARDLRPSHVLICSQRPTMPPGALIDEMPKPFDGGMADYCVIVYSFPHKWRTETRWLEPVVK